MESILFLRSLEPCDIMICNREHKLAALVVESKNRYVVPIGENKAPNFTVGITCVQPTHKELKVISIDDFTIVDGMSCYPATLTEEEEEVLINEIPCS